MATRLRHPDLAQEAFVLAGAATESGIDPALPVARVGVRVV